MTDAFGRVRRDRLMANSALLVRRVPLHSVHRVIRRISLATLLSWPFAASAEYSLRPGDTIAVSTRGPFAIAHESVVDVDGRVTLPVVGQMTVAGMTLSQAQAEIGAGMSNEPLRLVSGDGQEIWLNLQPSEILVEVARYAPVFVSGSVAQPGRFDFTPGMTVRQLIASAGGLGVAPLADDPSGRLSIELAADREVAVQRLDSLMMQIERLREELRSVTAAAVASTPAPDTPATPDEVAPAASEEATVAASQTQVEDEAFAEEETSAQTAAVDDGVTRPRARRTGEDQPVPASPEAAATSIEEVSPELQVPEEPQVTEAAASEVPSPSTTNGDSDTNLSQVGRELVAASATIRGVDQSSSQRLIEEMNMRLELLRRRQTEEEALVDRDRAEVARVKDLIERGLVPATESDAAERTLLMSTMQSYDTADMVARLEIDLSRMTADLERQPSEAAREILVELEGRLAEAEVAQAQLNSIDQRLALLGGPAPTQTALEFEFVLHRGSGDDAVAAPVDEDEPLLPGDSLEVMTSLDAGAAP